MNPHSTLSECSACGAVPTTTRLCSQCGTVAYCDKACQRMGWKTHKYACPILAAAQSGRRSVQRVHPLPRAGEQFIDAVANALDARDGGKGRWSCGVRNAYGAATSPQRGHNDVDVDVDDCRYHSSPVATLTHHGATTATATTIMGASRAPPSDLMNSSRENPERAVPHPVGFTIIDAGPRGRGAAAATDLVPGDLILDEAPVAAVPQVQYSSSVCHTCFQPLAAQNDPASTVRCCERCAASWWCSTACEEAGRAGHATECTVLRQFQPADRASLHGVRFFMQLIDVGQGRRGQDRSAVTVAPPVAFASRRDAKTMDTLIGQIQRLVPPTLVVSRDAIRNYIMAVEANGFFITDIEGRRLGNGYYPSAALFNHSCNPNTIVHFEKGRVQLRALVPMATGQELFISYTELYRPTVLRRNDLHAKKNFMCTCSRCQLDVWNDKGDRLGSCIDAFACPTKGCCGYARRVTERHASVSQRSPTQDCVQCVLCGSVRDDKLAHDLARGVEAATQACEVGARLLGGGQYAQCVDHVTAALKATDGVLHPLHHERFELLVLAVDALSLIAQTMPTSTPRSDMNACATKLLAFATASYVAMQEVYGHNTYNPRALRMLMHIGTALGRLASTASEERLRLFYGRRRAAVSRDAVRVATVICGADSDVTMKLKHAITDHQV
eukprot:m.51506 g.51506  ORF g.51506 m.51506 type:complete len:671 (-) comp7315_c0_seq1:36-2048(-)